MIRTICFRVHIGGYWALDDTYNGGSIRNCRVDFENSSLSMLKEMVTMEGFGENMCNFSYCHNQKRINLSSDSDVVEMIQCFLVWETLNVYVVRSDDPWLDDVHVGEDELENEEENDSERVDFCGDDYVGSDDYDSDGENVEFYVGQSFVTKDRCKEIIEKYAVKEKFNIKFQKCEKKKVSAECVHEGCKWRIYAYG